MNYFPLLLPVPVVPPDITPVWAFLVTVAVPTPWLDAPPLAFDTATEEIDKPPALALTVPAPEPLPTPAK